MGTPVIKVQIISRPGARPYTVCSVRSENGTLYRSIEELSPAKKISQFVLETAKAAKEASELHDELGRAHTGNPPTAQRGE